MLMLNVLQIELYLAIVYTMLRLCYGFISVNKQSGIIQKLFLKSVKNEAVYYSFMLLFIFIGTLILNTDVSVVVKGGVFIFIEIISSYLIIFTPRKARQEEMRYYSQLIFLGNTQIDVGKFVNCNYKEQIYMLKNHYVKTTKGNIKLIDDDEMLQEMLEMIPDLLNYDEDDK